MDLDRLEMIYPSKAGWAVVMCWPDVESVTIIYDEASHFELSPSLSYRA